MKPLSIIHTADLHLGSSFSSFKDQRIGETLSNEQFQILTKLENYQKEKEAQLILIAGDLFDSPSVNKGIIDRVKASLERMAPARVILVAGNHDPYIEGGYYDAPWPDNVYIAKPGQNNRFIFQDLAVEVDALSFSELYHKTSLYPAEETVEILIEGESDSDIQPFRILIMHGEFDVLDSNYNPIPSSSIPDETYDYVALGHIHMESEGKIGQRGATWAYPGPPQGRGFDELYVRHFRYGEIQRLPAKPYYQYHQQEWEKFPSHHRAFLIHEIDGTETYTETELVDLILKDLDKWQASLSDLDLETSLLRLQITGEPAFSAYQLDPSYLKRAVEEAGYFYIQIEDLTREPYDPDHLKNIKGFGEIFVGVIEGREKTVASQADREQLVRARDLILKTQRRLEHEN